ncbi:hypothetical protein P4310_28730, partial [Bacillus thuringiensis]|nr:hypothetical protein [Bacillus thuringiensis]
FSGFTSILWVLSMSIVDAASKGKLHSEKMKPVRVYFACLFLINPPFGEISVQMNKILFCIHP